MKTRHLVEDRQEGIRRQATRPILTALFFVSCVVCSSLSDRVLSHELGRASDSAQAPRWNAARLSFMPIDRLPPLSPSVGHPGIEYVIVLPNRWSQTQDIHVCFVGGNDALRTRILQVASQWFTHANLKLAGTASHPMTCVDHDTSEVRIGFAEPGYWSYIGTDGINNQLISNNLVSMNLQGFDTSPPAEPRFTGVILHEWGHALGLHHEHQSPAGGCDAEYDWEKLYAYYKDNYGWDKQMVDDNVRQLMADRSAYDWSNTDPDSIMIYGSNPDFLKNGIRSKCYFHDNNALSNLDIMGIERAYPRNAPQAALKFQATTLPIALGLGLEKNVQRALEIQNGLVQKQMERVK